MKKQRIFRRILLIFLISFFIASPIRFDKLNFYEWKADGADLLTINTDTTWKKSDNIVLDKNVTIIDGATLTIEKGAIITIKGESKFITVSNGRIAAEGTNDEKIIFRADQSQWSTFGIVFQDRNTSEPSFFRYTRFLNGGYYPCFLQNNKNNNIFNTAYACPLGGVIEYYSGKVHIENSEFIDSFQGAIHIGVYEDENENYYNDDYLEVANSNFSGSGDRIAVDINVHCDTGNCKTKTTLKNNWYGDESGPSSGERVLGNRGYDGYRENDLIVDPVIVIPGIMGSMPSKILAGKMVLDPILHVYDNLIASFQKNGYKKDINLFDFPYQWRDSNIISADELKNKIEAIKNDTKNSKIDVVAHSMGGLLTRQYIENSNYQNDIDQFITLGTPHKGAPKTYTKWEAGEGLDDLLDKVSKGIFSLEAHSLGYSSLQEYIQNRVISVKELLPDYDYLKKVSDGEMKNYPSGYPRNEFLENINSQSRIDNLSKVSFVNIIGKTDNDETINKFRITDSTVSGSWEHGMPENFYNYETDRGIEYGEGDETVPFSSADGISSNKKIEINSIHGDLPTKGQCYVIKELTGKEECDYVSTFERIKDILTFGIFSPIDIQVIDDKGRKAGKDFETGEIFNEIPGAYYSGYDTDNEFLTIPNPIDGEYRILTQGTGDGEYKIQTSKISEDEATGETKESTAEIAGIAQNGQEEEKKVEVSGDEVAVFQEDKIAPEISINSPEAKEYLNNQKVAINYSLSDNISLPEEITSEKYLDVEKISESEIDLPLLAPAEHKMKVSASDKAGNLGEKEVTFSVSTNIGAIISNLKILFKIGTHKKEKYAEIFRNQASGDKNAVEFFGKYGKRRKNKSQNKNNAGK